MAGILEQSVIKEAKTLLLEVYEKIGLDPSKIDLNLESTEIRLYKTVLILVELYHIIKFLKDEGVFQEGKWWTQQDPDCIAILCKKMTKVLDPKNENPQVKFPSQIHKVRLTKVF